MDIGKKIKELRLKNSLTLQELASRCEVTKGFLSQVENDLTSPSISTLEDILEALGSNLSEFFQTDKAEKFVFRKDDFFEDETDDYKISFIIPNAQKHDMEPIIIEINPDCSSKTMTPYEGEEFGLVLSGIVKLSYDDKDYILHQGETFYIYGDKEHKLTNIGLKNCRILWVSNPPSF